MRKKFSATHVTDECYLVVEHIVIFSFVETPSIDGEWSFRKGAIRFRRCVYTWFALCSFNALRSFEMKVIECGGKQGYNLKWSVIDVHRVVANAIYEFN